MKVQEKNFREIYRKVCLLTGDELIKKINLRDVFDYPPDEVLNGLTAYACIDLNGEFIFEVLAGAKVEEEQIKIFPASYKKKSAKALRLINLFCEGNPSQIVNRGVDIADVVQIRNENFAHVNFVPVADITARRVNNNRRAAVVAAELKHDVPAFE